MNAEVQMHVEPAGLEALDGNRALLQSRFWAQFRRQFGWQAQAFRCRYREASFILLVLTRPLPFGLRLAYVPHGPEVSEPVQEREHFLVELSRALQPHLAGCLFLRFDLPRGGWAPENPPAPLEPGGGLWKAPMDIQPPSTVILDLAASERQLLAGMKTKTRYNIRLAEKKGVRVEQGSISDLEQWYALYRETARRDRITLHSYAYYRRLFELAAGTPGPGSRQASTEAADPPAVGCARGASAPAPELHLLLARHEGELLAGIILAMRGDSAWYLYGASSGRKRNLMPSYALQWQAIRLARQRGCRSYDLFGIPPADDPAHPMHGLYRFKTGFGGRIFNRLGCYDFAYRSALYGLYRVAERARSLYFRKLRKNVPQ